MKKSKLNEQMPTHNNSHDELCTKKARSTKIHTLSLTHSDFKNNWVRLKYLGTESTVNYFYGNGINVMFIIENISPYSINVTATQISVNGHVILEEQELLSEELLPEERSIEKLRLYYKRDRLAEHQIFDPINIKDISFNLIARISDEQSVIFQEKISVRI